MQPSHEHIFADERPFAACHASTVAALPGGRLAAAWFGGTQEGDPDTAIWWSVRSEAGWSPPRLLAKVAAQAHWNPVLLQDPIGALHLWFKVGVSPREWSTWTMTSANGGLSWTAPRELLPGDSAGRGPVKNKPIILSDGAWLAGASVETDERWAVFVDRSADRGRTWEAGAMLDAEPRVSGLGAIQPALWESAPGRVHMLARSTCGRIVRSDSADGGRSWTPLAPTELPNNNSGIDLAALPDGRLVLAYNPVTENWGARTPLTLLVSADNGASWRRWLDLESGEGEYSYPAVIVTPGGVAVSYTWRRERIACWTIMWEGRAREGFALPETHPNAPSKQ